MLRPIKSPLRTSRTEKEANSSVAKIACPSICSTKLLKMLAKVTLFYTLVKGTATMLKTVLLSVQTIYLNILLSAIGRGKKIKETKLTLDNPITNST